MCLVEIKFFAEINAPILSLRLAEIFALWDTVGLSFCIFWDLKMKNLGRCQILIRRIGLLFVCNPYFGLSWKL